MSPMIPLRESDGLNHGIYLGNQRISNAANQAKTYHPRGSMIHEEPSNNILLNDNNNDASGIQNSNRFDIVQLEFQDFFDLMKLKI